MSTPVFIVGAGFSLAANAKYKMADRQFAKCYPLATDLGIECFGSSWNSAEGVEAAFAAALEGRQREPITKLVTLIQTADYYLGPAEARDRHSVYGKLLVHFPGAQFISFNYDSLLEQVLLRRKLWSPHDGFGMPVKTGESPQGPAIASSKVLVIHLHGSLLLYAVEYDWQQKDPQHNMTWMTPRTEPEFRFDPDALGHCFDPFTRASLGLGFRYPEERVIVPLPDKRESLRERYWRVVFDRACGLLETTEQVIAIGYRFAECDRLSFEPLLKTTVIKQIPLWVVAPDAIDIARRLRSLHPRLGVHAISTTFTNWAEQEFQLGR